MPMRMPLATRKQALELAARFIEANLNKMREKSRQQYQHQQDLYKEGWDGREFPVTSSNEGDLLKAVEWASAAATLRAMAEGLE